MYFSCEYNNIIYSYVYSYIGYIFYAYIIIFIINTRSGDYCIIKVIQLSRKLIDILMWHGPWWPISDYKPRRAIPNMVMCVLLRLLWLHNVLYALCRFLKAYEIIYTSSNNNIFLQNVYSIDHLYNDNPILTTSFIL